MLRLPVVGAEQPHEIVFKKIALLMLVQTAEDGLEHVLIDHESREDVISPHPFIECREDESLVSLSDRDECI